MNTDDAREPIVYRFGTRTPCCARIVRHVDASTIVCRGCGTMFTDVTALVVDAFPGTLDVTSMTPGELLHSQ